MTLTPFSVEAFLENDSDPFFHRQPPEKMTLTPFFSREDMR